MYSCRAIFTPGNPSRATFMAIIMSTQAIDNAIALPLNLPLRFSRVPKEPFSPSCLPRSKCKIDMEDKVLIDRNADIDQGDQGYYLRYQNRQLMLYHALKVEQNLTAALNIPQPSLPKFNEFADIPDTQMISSNQFAYPDPTVLMSVSGLHHISAPITYIFDLYSILNKNGMKANNKKTE